MGFVDFTKLLIIFSSLAQPFNPVISIPEHGGVILSQHKACAGRFREETVGKRTGPIAQWLPRRLLITRFEIIFVTISPFRNRSAVSVRKMSFCTLQWLSCCDSSLHWPNL